MNRETWVATHPYLRPVAEVEFIVDAVASAVRMPTAPLPDWDTYADDFHAGVPLLESARPAIDLSPAEHAVLPLIGKLATAPLPVALAQQCRVLERELEDAGRSRTPFLPTDPELFRYLSWAVLARYLRPVVTASAEWRNEERWLRNYCPTCGERPTMAQLVGKDPGRLRQLWCGRCRTRWRYRRTGCPFCDAQDEHRLAVMAIEGEGGLRIDYCDDCRGYLKTYDGEGDETVLLADWTSLHLDLIARDRGLMRLAASLYDLRD